MSVHAIYPINVSESAQLLLTPCPGTAGETLSAILQQLSFGNSPALLSMITKQELLDNDLADLGKDATTFDLQWFHLPIAEAGVPDQAWEAHWQVILPRLLQLLSSGVNLSLHSMTDGGRAALVAARLMLALGFELDEAMSKIQGVYPKAFTLPAQLKYIQKIAANSTSK